MKKKLFAFAVAAMAVMGAQAQNVIEGHEYVDLGLPSGTLWATMNVGASSTSDSGTNYPSIPQDFGWGQGWTYPTEEQWNELVENCTVTHTGDETMSEYSNITITFTSKRNSNSLVTPGYIWDDTSVNPTERFYLGYPWILTDKTVYPNAEYPQSSYITSLMDGYIRPVAVEHTIVVPTSIITSVPDGWTVKAGATASEVQEVTITNGTTEGIEVGSVVIVTPANIPAGKKIKSIKVLPTE